MSEIAAIKVEIAAAIKRRMTDDGRSPADLFSIASTALGESMADIIFAAAKDESHGRALLRIIGNVIEQRWRHLTSLTNEKDSRR